MTTSFPPAKRQQRDYSLSHHSVSDRFRLSSQTDSQPLPNFSTYQPFGILYPNTIIPPILNNLSPTVNAEPSFSLSRYNLFSVFRLNSTPPLCQNQTILIRNFDSQKSAADSFPLLLTDATTGQAIGCFQASIDLTRSNQSQVCASCGLFVSANAANFLQPSDLTFQQAVQKNVFCTADLDCCAYVDGVYSFCSTCFNSVLKLKLPKFGAANVVNTTFCQSYPKELRDLTLVEEAFIARAHPVISILKLRPSKSGAAISYQHIRGHAVVLPQNPRPLLDLLPSDDLVLHDIVRIVWAGDRPHTAADIHVFAKMRREKVLTALRWLKQNNILYHNIVINIDLLHS